MKSGIIRLATCFWLAWLLAGSMMAEASPARRSALTDAPGIIRIADLPDDPAFAAYGPAGEVQLDLGYAYREISVFWMPIWAYPTGGMVLYAGSGETLALAPVGAAELARIEALTGTDHSGYVFPLWQHLWGWAPLAALGLGWRLLHRREQRRRDAMGLI